MTRECNKVDTIWVFKYVMKVKFYHFMFELLKD